MMVVRSSSYYEATLFLSTGLHMLLLGTVPSTYHAMNERDVDVTDFKGLETMIVAEKIVYHFHHLKWL